MFHDCFIQGRYSEASIMKCFNLFMKEEELDLDERPVSSTFSISLFVSQVIQGSQSGTDIPFCQSDPGL